MKTRGWVFYPFLFAPYPILALYAQNLHDTRISQLAWPIPLAVAATALVWGVFRLAVGDSARAGLLTLLALGVFDTIEQAPEWVDGWLSYLTTFWVRREVHVWPALVVGTELTVAAVCAVVVLKRPREPAAWTLYLNRFALVLIALPLIDIARASGPIQPAALSEATGTVGGPLPSPGERPGLVATARPSGPLPDIYYIILDGYARGDVMAELFDFNNGPFLDRLERKGFYVARQSTANYCQTPLCLSSSLNMVYLDGFIPAASQDKTQLGPWIGDGAVVRTLRGLGYQFVTFATGFAETEHPQADVYLAASPYLSPFHHMLISCTPLARFLPLPALRDEYSITRERTLFLLETVPGIARWKGPTLTFAHVLSPHPPFVFGEDGEDVSPHERNYNLTDGQLFQRYYGDREAYAAGYRKQAAFLTKRVEEMIDGILANSAEPPVIILQSDHGSGMRLSTESVEQSDLHERMSILNAYYLPGAGAGRGRDALYASISPVNSFRVLLNTYFGAGLDLLPDRCYFSTWTDPFQFVDVTDQVRDTPKPVGRRPEAGGVVLATAWPHGGTAGASDRSEAPFAPGSGPGPAQSDPIHPIRFLSVTRRPERALHRAPSSN